MEVDPDSFYANLDENAPPPPGVLDMEASGFGRESYPIEVGYVLPDGNTYCCLIRPLPSWTHWNAEAERVHRIAPATLQANGRSVTEVAQHLNDHLNGQIMYCDGWAHDYPWLATLFEAAQMTPNFRLENLRVLLSEREAAYWDVLKQQVARELRLQRHRASSDAKLLQRTLMRLRDPLPSRY
jgi:hypothetical protein